MCPFELIDPLYEEFVQSLHGPLAESARELAVTLRLAPERGVPWSEVFSHEVTLGAPALVAEAFSGTTSALLEAAVSAHMLAVIEAFGTDRIADRQVPVSPELLSLLDAMRSSRDAALARVASERSGGAGTYAQADRTTRAAIEKEAAILSAGKQVTFEAYETVSLGKQAVGFPASLALARAMGADLAQLHAVSELLGGVWLGLQMADDVADWEDDAARVGAWAVLLAGAERAAGPAAVRMTVLQSGALVEMLTQSHRHFRSAERRSLSLGAKRLARWAAERAVDIGKLLEAERAAPGYVARRQSLGAWAAEIFQ